MVGWVDGGCSSGECVQQSVNVCVQWSVELPSRKLLSIQLLSTSCRWSVEWVTGQWSGLLVSGVRNCSVECEAAQWNGLLVSGVRNCSVEWVAGQWTVKLLSGVACWSVE